MTGIQKYISSIDLNNRVFVSIANTSNGEVSDDTIFHYFQQDNTIWGKYAGGEIERGTLIGKFRIYIFDCTKKQPCLKSKDCLSNWETVFLTNI